MENNTDTGISLIAFLFAITIMGIGMTGWVKNIIKLSNCDFEAPYQSEVIHGIGIVPIIGAVTGWIDVGR
jgi:Tfp pilus assembly protein PilV